MVRQALTSNPVEGRQRSQLFTGNSIGNRGSGFYLDCRNHQILCGVLDRNKLEHFRSVARPFQQVRAQRVGYKFRLALLENSVALRRAKYRRRGQLGAQLLLATRADDEHLGSRGNASCQRVIGRSVARVQSNQYVAGFERDVGNCSRREGKSIRHAVLLRDPVAELDQVRPRLYSANFGVSAE